MSISLVKGQNISLTKDNPNLDKLMIGLGWDPNNTGADFDLDAYCFIVDKDNNLLDQKDFVYFNNLTSSCGAVEHQGDNLTGEGDGDDEQIFILLNKIPEQKVRIFFYVSIFEAKNRKQNFGQISNSYIRAINADNNKEIIRYDLQEDFSVETTVNLGEVYINNDEWKFRAIGAGEQNEIGDIAKQYGL